MVPFNRCLLGSFVAITATVAAGLMAQPSVAQTYNAVCLLVDSQGNALDLSRICGSQSQTSSSADVKPIKARPASLPIPSQGEVPDYGVIFLSVLQEEPIHLGDREHYVVSSVGNASSQPVDEIRLYYDISVSVEGEYASIGKGSKVIHQDALEVGDRVSFYVSSEDVMDQVIEPFRTTEDISIQVTALGWTEADGSRNSFSPDSYRLAEGIGRCYFPWELDWAGRGCGSRAVSNRL